jgi:linearmycin/streptolysin S transport system permease protein
MKTNSLRVTLTAAWKDLQILFKDIRALVILIGLPMVFSLMFGTINDRLSKSGEEGITFPIVVVNQDTGMYGDQITSILESIDVLRITELTSPDEAEQEVRDSNALAAILIPAELSNKVNAYEQSEVQIITDPTQEQYASIVTGIMKDVIAPVIIQGELTFGIQSILSDYPGFQEADPQTKQAALAQNLAVNLAEVQKIQSDPWVKVEQKNQEGRDLILVPPSMFSLLVPGFTVLFAFFIVGAMSADLLQERDEGSLRRLIAAPIHRWTIIAGKMLAYVVLVIVQVTLIFGAASLFFDMPLGNSLVGLALVTLAMGFAATGLGMLVAALSRTYQQADTTGLLLGFIMGALGGCFIIGTPVQTFKSGGILETLSKLTPQAHALMGYDTLLNQGGGLVAVLPQVGILCAFGLVFLLVAVWRFKFR